MHIANKLRETMGSAEGGEPIVVFQNSFAEFLRKFPVHSRTRKGPISTIYRLVVDCKCLLIPIRTQIGTAAATMVSHRKTDVGRVCVCSKVQFGFIRYNGIAICSRLAGGGRGPSVDLGLSRCLFLCILRRGKV